MSLARFSDGDQGVVLLATTSSCHELATWANDEEYRRAMHYRYPSDRQRSLLAHGLKRRALSLLTSAPASALRFTSSLYGKPQLIGYPDIEFNISHSGRWVALIISRGAEVGIDVEFPRLINRPAVAAQVLSPRQQQDLRRNNHWQRFLGYWTQKEALSKALGYGLHMDYRRIACHGRLGQQQLITDYGAVDVGSYALETGVLSIACRAKAKMTQTKASQTRIAQAKTSRARHQFRSYYFSRGDFHPLSLDEVNQHAVA